MAKLQADWIPTTDMIKTANISQFMSELNISSRAEFHRWSVDYYADFWQHLMKKLDIKFKQKPAAIVDLTIGITSPKWLPGAKINIMDSCFNAKPSAPALIYEDAQKKLCTLSYAELNELSNQIANSLINAEFKAGDAIGIIMPMSIYAVAIYIGIIKMGGVVVSIADSFSSEEIALRSTLANTKAIFTQDVSIWGGKKNSLYEKIVAANPARIIVLPHDNKLSLSLREVDISWEEFLSEEKTFVSAACNPMSACNILFSSGTTAEPKAIPWNHTTAIKAASDAYFHQNIKPGDVLAWPTNLGWMMGPWLIFAALINQATIALYTEAPKDRQFGEFIAHAKVTMLGVVPTLVATWRQSRCMENLDWRHIKVFSSTGECSNPEDMRYLMKLANNKPVIEYCGGTEIGGAYISSTVIDDNYASLFSTPTMGLDFVIIDEAGKEANLGEVAILSPSMGLSTELLNADHYHIYFENMPIINEKILRRHGDQIERLENGYYRLLGRVDDTMNLGGIKISAAEIERALIGVDTILETAAISIPPVNNGPNQLVIFAATNNTPDKKTIHQEMQRRINTRLNPLFKIHDVILVKELPKTASNKIMRRTLRKDYMGGMP